MIIIVIIIIIYVEVTRENNLSLFSGTFLHLIMVQLFMLSICQEMLPYIQTAGTCLKVRPYLHLELITAPSRNKLPETNDCSIRPHFASNYN
jgi:hypothetical protein